MASVTIKGLPGGQEVTIDLDPAPAEPTIDLSVIPTTTVGVVGQNPTTAPNKIGDFYFRPPSTFYIAIGTESPNDWMQM